MWKVNPCVPQRLLLSTNNQDFLLKQLDKTILETHYANLYGPRLIAQDALESAKVIGNFYS